MATSANDESRYEDGEEDEDEGEEDIMNSGRPYVPPATDRDGPKPSFGEQCDSQFIVPTRLHDKPYELIEAANDWHYAMMNDHPRNEFYRDALRRVITSSSVVLEIGAGSGLLSIIAASLGAKCVVAIEANRHLADVATEIIKRNGYEGRIHIINRMSTDVTREEVLEYGDPDVLLSEILGTLLLGESALHYVSDARRRLCKPKGVTVVPEHGCQFASLVQSPDINSITSVKCWEGIDLRWFNTLQDTTSMVFTKQYGFRFSSCEYSGLADKQGVLSVDFGADSVGIWRTERRVRFQVRHSGTVHAIMASWEVYAADRALVMSTHPDETLHNFPRDMQWGQGLQLIEDMQSQSLGDGPTPYIVSEGEWLWLVTRYSKDGVTLQFQLERATEPVDEAVEPPADEAMAEAAPAPASN